MKKVLFISVTNYNFKENTPSQLKEKFEGLSMGIVPFVIARGKPFRKKIWGTEFYLLPPGFSFWPLSLFFVFYITLAKGIDTIVSQSPLMEGFVGFLLKRTLKKELIVEIHGDWQEGPFLSKKRKFESIERKITPTLAKISLRNADKIRAVANYLIIRAKEIAPGKHYFLFPTFTDLDSFLNEENLKMENFILSVGQLEKVKGTEYLIDAFSKIEKDFPQFKLVLIGDGAERKNLELQVSRLSQDYGGQASYKLQERIDFKGKLSLEETKGIMKNCYCLVSPSLSEGLPRVIMEAMALSKPVIGSNVGGIPELVLDGRTGFLLKAGDPEELASKLRILLNQKELAIEMGQRGRKEIADRFSNDKYIKNYLEMINAPFHFRPSHSPL